MNEAMKHQTERLQPMSVPEFSQLGVGQVAYIRSIVVNGMPAFAIYSAAGQQLAVVPTRESAVGIVRQNEMEPASPH